MAAGSVRRSAMLVVVAVVVSPVAFILVTHLLESVMGDRTLDRVERSAAQVARALGGRGAIALDDPGVLREAAEPLVSRHGQKVRVLAPDGSTRVVADELSGGSFITRAGDLFYGWQRRRVLDGIDAHLAPLAERTEVRQALANGSGSRCWHEPEGNLFLCEAARAVELGAQGTYVVDVQGSSRQALETLYESRRQLFKLSLFALLLGAVLAVWMTRRIIRPVERLREQVLARAEAALPHPRLDAGGTGRPSAVRGPSAEISDLTEAFNTLLAALAERSRTTERFLADLAHEFKNPVATIRASADQLREGAPAPERIAKLAELIHQSSIGLDAMVTQFLELAKAEGGLPNEPREPVDLAALLRGLTGAIRSSGRYPGVAIELDGAQEALMVRGVPGRLESAFRNLLDNGASFAGAGGRVDARLSRVDGAVEIRISDSGPGVAPENLPRLFERFFTTRGDRHGTGLGLALTRAVVEAHGGSIRAESPPGGGACFAVRLPRARS